MDITDKNNNKVEPGDILEDEDGFLCFYFGKTDLNGDFGYFMVMDYDGEISIKFECGNHIKKNYNKIGNLNKKNMSCLFKNVYEKFTSRYFHSPYRLR